MSDELAARRARKEPIDLADLTDRTVTEMFRLGAGIERLESKWADKCPEVARDLRDLLTNNEGER